MHNVFEQEPAVALNAISSAKCTPGACLLTVKQNISRILEGLAEKSCGSVAGRFLFFICCKLACYMQCRKPQRTSFSQGQLTSASVALFD